MAPRLVECLNCGALRQISPLPTRPSAPNECARCGYVGWADTDSLDETLRRSLRDHTVEQRRGAIVW